MKRVYTACMLAMLAIAIVSTTAIAQSTVYLPIVARDGSANSIGVPVAEETPQPTATPTIGDPVSEPTLQPTATPQPTAQPTATPQPTATVQPIEVTPQPQNFDPADYVGVTAMVCNSVSCTTGWQSWTIDSYSYSENVHSWTITIYYVRTQIEGMLTATIVHNEQS